MPLDSNVLSTLMQSKLNDAGFNGDQMSKMTDAMSEAVVEHFVSNALVTVTVKTTGSAAAQAGSGEGGLS